MNIQRVYLLAFFGFAAITAAICFWGRRLKEKSPWRILQSFSAFASLQCTLSLAFIGCYVLYVKNGFAVSPSRLGVAFFPFSVFVFFLAWRLKYISRSALSLAAPALYTVFLLINCRAGILKLVLYNPIYGFIAAETPFPLSAVAALLPFAAVAVGRALGLIDKKKHSCYNA